MDIGTYDVLILRADSRPYEFNGKSGVSHSLRFLENGFVFKAKITEALYNKCKDSVEKRANVSLVISSYNELPRLECTEIALSE